MQNNRTLQGPRWLVAAVLALTAVGCIDTTPDALQNERGKPDLTSDLHIEPAKSFLLGGGQPASFCVDAYNKGSTTVTIFCELAGKSVTVATIAPGGRASHEFAAAERAVLVNGSEKSEARLDVLFWGKPSSLEMTYCENGVK